MKVEEFPELPDFYYFNRVNEVNFPLDKVLETSIIRLTSQSIRRCDMVDKEKAILDAAFSCFAKKGYHKTTMDDIARAAGISKGSLYWYFRSKRDLYLALLDSRIREAIKVIEDSAVQKDSLKGMLIEGGIIFHRFVMKSKDMAPAMLDFLSEAMRDDEIRQKMEEFYSRHVDELLNRFSYFSEFDISDDERRKLVISIMVFMHGLSTIGRFCRGIEEEFEELWSFFIDRMFTNRGDGNV